MPHVFNPAARSAHTPATQHALLAETARSEFMLAQDLGISQIKLRLLRWSGCAPAAIRVDNVVYYTFDEVECWLRRFG